MYKLINSFSLTNLLDLWLDNPLKHPLPTLIFAQFYLSTFHEEPKKLAAFKC